jgi:hypothetical protein
MFSFCSVESRTAMISRSGFSSTPGRDPIEPVDSETTRGGIANKRVTFRHFRGRKRRKYFGDKMTKLFSALIIIAIAGGPSVALAQFVDSHGGSRSTAQHMAAKRCAVSAGLPIAKDGSWNSGTPEQLAKYQACKAKNNVH